MKTVKLLTIVAITGVAIFFAACSQTESIDESIVLAEKSAQVQALQGDSCTFEGEVTEEEIAGLKLMREEEKLARDVYKHFFSVYGDVIFENIAKSENAHMNAVLRILEGYEIEDPALEGAGEFNNEELVTLYSELISEGEKGLVEALKVGATIEDLDIKDLQDLLAVTSNEDIKRVYENLLAGSENHMRAFVNTLTNLGENYAPQFISTEEFAAILAGNNSARKGNGQGNGINAGNGNTNGSKGTNASNGICDGTQAGTGNGNQSGSADGTQTGISGSNQYGSQSGNSNGNSGSKGNGRG